MLDSFRSRIAAARKSNELFFAALIPVERIVSIFGKDKKVSGTVSEVLASFSHFVDKELKQKTGSSWLTSVRFWGVIWLVGTIDASAVREMNL